MANSDDDIDDREVLRPWTLRERLARNIEAAGSASAEFFLWLVSDNTAKLEGMSAFAQTLAGYVFIQVAVYFLADRMGEADWFSGLGLAGVYIMLSVFSMIFSLRIGIRVSLFFSRWAKFPTELPTSRKTIGRWAAALAIWIVVIGTLNVITYHISGSLRDFAKTQMPVVEKAVDPPPPAQRRWVPSCKDDHCVA